MIRQYDERLIRMIPSVLFVRLFRFVDPAVRAVPFALGFCAEAYAGKVVPLDDAARIVTANHLSVGDVVA